MFADQLNNESDAGRIIGEILLRRLVESDRERVADLEKDLEGRRYAKEVYDRLKDQMELEEMMRCFGEFETQAPRTYKKTFGKKKRLRRRIALFSGSVAALLVFILVVNHLSTGYNTITTPRGEMFKLALPDGTMVWLNAGSILHYPVAFAGKGRREVTLRGEAYFEVSSNKFSPFIIHTARQRIEVLGTTLDVCAYDNEPFESTTLLQGSVRVTSGNISRILRPGEQAQIAIGNGSNHLGIKITDDTATNRAIAWQQNFFDFNNANLYTIMREISRWYDVDVVYEGPVSADLFSARISRSLPVSTVLHILELTKQVSFVFDGRKIIVRK